MAHINLTREADAHPDRPGERGLHRQAVQGRADELLSLACLARPIERCPLLVAPAMNREMWAHPATRRNVAQLAPTARRCSARQRRPGLRRDRRRRMLEAAELRDALIAFFQPKLLAGKRVLVTAGRPSSRSIRCAASPTARAARWASRSPAPPPRQAPT
jgi:phosphopantothenoylcysteine decarboxylase/phosphopantothenate--cysteine ligase